MRIYFKIIIGILIFIILLIFSSYLIPLSDDEFEEATELAAGDGRFIAVEGVTTYVEEAGKSSGDTVVLIHGFGGGTFNWQYTLPGLASAGYHVVAFDLKGFHLSDKSKDEDYSHPSQAQYIKNVLKALNIDQASFIAHSMGANVVSHFAFTNPEMIDKFVIVDGALSTENNFGLSVAGKLLKIPPLRRWGQVYARSQVSEEKLTEHLEVFYHDQEFITEPLVEEYRTVTKMENWDVALMKFISDYNQNTLPKPMSEIKNPILIIWGAHDKIIPLQTGEALRDSIPDASWTVLTDAGHLPMEERSSAFNERVIEFLQEE